MAATNYKPDKPTNCTRCGKAIVQTKHGRRLYCYKCREEMQQANQHNYWVRKREANTKVPKKNCHINWQLGDKLILNGDPPQQIADNLNCSVHTVLSHKSRMKHGKIVYRERERTYESGSQYYDYRAALNVMIVEMFKKRGNGMSLDEFKTWLMTDKGQELLHQVNQGGGI